MGVMLIQLELISVFTLSVIFGGVGHAGGSPLFLYALISLIAAEASLSLSVLLALSRQGSQELEKFQI